MKGLDSFENGFEGLLKMFDLKGKSCQLVKFGSGNDLLFREGDVIEEFLDFGTIVCNDSFGCVPEGLGSLFEVPH